MGQAALTEENCVIRRRGVYPERRLDVFTDVFDTVGTSLLRDAPECDVVVMDEIGPMESGSPRFCGAVLRALDSRVPILASVRDKDTPFLRAVRQHPSARCLWMAENNSDALFREALELLK